MKIHVYRYTCLTNLHVGSGDVNYSVVDNEVERDTNGNPIIHASGVKGALRSHFTKKLGDETLKKVFGSPASSKEDISSGAYKFLDAHMVSRPMRVSGSTNLSSIPVISIPALNEFLVLLSAFGANTYGVETVEVPAEAFGEAAFLYHADETLCVEGEPSKKMSDPLYRELKKLESLIGTTFAVAKEPENYYLPVIARNFLVNGESKNLWYEEVVPHGSVFYQILLTPDDEMALDLTKEPIQFGGNASVGCGFVKIEKMN